MSLNQLIQDQYKPWCDIRVASIKIDQNFGEETDLTLNLSGALTSSCDCKIIKYGNLITVRLNSFNETTTSQNYIYAVNFPDEFIPNNKETTCNIVVVNDGSNQPGAIDFNQIEPIGSTGIRFQALNNNPSEFTNGANAGIPGPIVFSYYLE